MGTDTEVVETQNLLADRIDLLTLLEGSRLPKREIVDELGYSRSTVNRAITQLADAGLVDDAPRGCQTTFVGSLLATQYRAYRETVGDVIQAREVLTALPTDADLPAAVLADADVVTPEGPHPYDPYHAVEKVLDSPGADGDVRVYVPSFSNPRGLELAQHLAETVPLEIVFTDELVAELTEDRTDEIETLREIDRFTGYRTASGPRYTLIIAAAESGAQGAIVTHTADRNLGGVIVTDDAEALRWMERRYAEIRAESEPLAPP